LVADLTLKSAVAQGIQAAFGHAGIRIAFDHPLRNSPKLFAAKAAELGVKTVLDVGANLGQFALELRRYGYREAIVSFEPLSAAHAELERLATKDPRWRIAPRAAIGDAEGVAEINIAKNLASSSLLQVRDRSIEAAAESASESRERVAVRRLDDLVDSFWEIPFGMKLDTQGYELLALQGAPRILEQTRLVLSEMSLVPLYEGGAGFLEIYQFLESRNFQCVSLIQGFADNVRHELLQVDGVFVRK
jgi:FkbM family methyltransferase